MKRLLSLFLIILAANSMTAAAEEYFTLPEIREQSSDGWHKTYTDKFGRTIVVDIDIDVYGEQVAPVLEVGWGEYGKAVEDRMFKLDNNQPIGNLKAAKKRGGTSKYVYESVSNMNIYIQQKYGKEYGNELTLHEVYDFTTEKLKEQDLPIYDYLYETPMQFSLVYSINENTNEILVPAFYIVELQMKKRGLPIFNHVSESYLNRPTPFYFPSISIVVESESSYSIIERIFEEQKVIADDIPLCALNTVIQNIEKNIESGYIQNVISLRFGYSIYNDPSIVDVKRYSGYDAECYYLVPSWIIECAIVDNPKKDYESYHESRIRDITINAQTGEMLDYFDKSYKGYGDARYKGFVSWDDVKK